MLQPTVTRDLLTPTTCTPQQQPPLATENEALNTAPWQSSSESQSPVTGIAALKEPFQPSDFQFRRKVINLKSVRFKQAGSNSSPGCTMSKTLILSCVLCVPNSTKNQICVLLETKK